MPAAVVERPAAQPAVENAPAPKATVDAAPAEKAADRKAEAVRRATRPLKLPEVTASTTAEFLERYTGMRDKLRAELKAKVPSQDQNPDAFLASDALDAKFAKYVVLHEATPRGLAEFASKGKEHVVVDAGKLERKRAATGASGAACSTNCESTTGRSPPRRSSSWPGVRRGAEKRIRCRG